MSTIPPQRPIAPELSTPDPHQPDRELLAALQSPDRNRREGAVRKLYNTCRDRAAGALGSGKSSRKGRIDLDPESIALSVLGNELSRVPRVCRDDQHVKAYLTNAVKHKIFDRIKSKKGNNPGLNEEFDAHAASGPGPASVIEVADAVEADTRAFEALSRKMDAACRTREEQIMVHEFLIEGKGWSAVAAQVEKKVDAAKVSFHRLRARLLAAAVEPLQQHFTGTEWRMVHSLCIERNSAEKAAELLGCDTAHIKAIFRERVVPLMRTAYGRDGFDVLLRLLGRTVAIAGASEGGKIRGR